MTSLRNETSMTTVDPLQFTSDQIDHLTNVFYFWIFGVTQTTICSIGLLANLLSIAVLWKQRKIVTYKLFLALAFADLAVMCILLSNSLCFNVTRPTTIYSDLVTGQTLKVTFAFYFWFNTLPYFLNTFMCISSWCVVLVGIFRLIIVMFPLRANVYASPLRVNIAIGLVFFCSVPAQVPGYLMLKWVDGLVYHNTKMQNNIVWITVVNNVMPIILCCVTTTAILILLKKRQRTLQGSIDKEIASLRKREHRQLTITLILILLLFIVTNTPDTVFWAMNTAGYFDKHRVTWYNRTIIKEICTIPSWLNYSCNFFVYILANSNFRKDIKLMLRRCRSCLPGRSPTLRPANSSISTGISSLSTVQHTNQSGISSSEAL